MKRILLVGLLFISMPAITIAQKHAPRPLSSQAKPGIYPEGSIRLLGLSDIEGLTNWDLKIMRNEIFARHNYIFQTKDMVEYFYKQPWYSARFDNVTSLLTAIERKNIDFIKKYE